MPPVAKPWFRMHSDLLDNDKFDSLRAPLVKTWLKLLALANVTKPRGSLPPLKRISYRLRMSETQVSAALAELKANGLVDQRDGFFFMHDWDDWQAERDVSPTLRSRVNHANVTLTSRNNHAKREENHDRVEEEKDKEKEGEGEKKRSGIFVYYEKAFGHFCSPMERERMLEMEVEFPDECVEHSFREAAELNKRSLRYVDSICKDHKAKGTCYAGKPVGRNAVATPQAGDASAIYASFGIRSEDLPVRLPLAGRSDSGVATLDGHDD